MFSQTQFMKAPVGPPRAFLLCVYDPCRQRQLRMATVGFPWEPDVEAECSTSYKMHLNFYSGGGSYACFDLIMDPGTAMADVCFSNGAGFRLSPVTVVGMGLEVGG